MYSIIYHIFFWLKRIEKRRIEFQKVPLRIVACLIGYAEWFFNVPVRRWYEKHPSKKYGINQKARKQKVIVSFTSFPKRIEDVWLVGETLLRQSYKPDQIILWLATSQFEEFDSLPNRLTNLQNRGLTIRFCDDLRSHKKYYYVMQEHPEDLVILVDDDTFYSRDLVKKLVRLHQKYPKDIICMTPTMISDVYDLPSKWHAPSCDERIVHSYLAQPYSGQGTLYPPHSLDEANAFDKVKIMELCPYADDLWLKLMSMRKGTLVTAVYKYRSIPVNIYGTAEGSLYYINGEGKQNDVQWQNLLEYYGEENDT